MKYFDYIITEPIKWLIEQCYKIVPSYVFAIILFTLIIKLLLFPFSLWAQAQSVKAAKLKPQLDDIKAYFSHDWRLTFREQKKLYKKEKYSGFVSMLPLLLQLPIILGVIRAMDSMSVLDSTPPNILLPLLSGLSAFLLCYVQNICNVLAKTMKFFAKWGIAIFLTAFSLYFTFTAAIGFGIYWTAGNLIAIAVQLICNIIINPQKHITYKILPLPKKDKQLKRRQKEREKADVARFNKTKKILVFYSEASGFYKYFKGMIEYVLDNSKIRVHYLTSDIDDKVFDIKHERFHAYYCGHSKLISTFMKLDCKIMVMSMPDLHIYQYKRSVVNKNIEYIYVDHGFSSLSFVARKHACDYFDTIFCYGKNYNEEIRAMEAYYNTKEKTLVNTGYALYEKLKDSYVPKEKSEKIIIIAPSWQKDNIMESCIDDIMRELSGTDYRVILRPHPEFIKRFPQKIELLKSKYQNELQLDFSTDILSADILISDWSSVAWEFSFAANKPALFINTPKKIMNPDWEKYGVEPIEITLREKTGVTVEMDEIGSIREKIVQLEKIKNPREIIQNIMYDNKMANEISGEYIVRRIKNEANK